METINNAANAAVKAVWGEGEAKKEPVSGVTGDVVKGEPYDAGNLDTPAQEKIVRLYNAENETPAPPNTTTTATTTTSDQSPPRNTTLAAPFVKSDTSAAQHDTRHPDDVPDILDSKDLKGPGPKPIDVVAKKHGGDAGQAKKDSNTHGNYGGDTKQQASGQGTGEAHVHATGFLADGGNFDAKNPGAGKEADRLIHHHDHPSALPIPQATTTATTSSAPAERTSQDSKDSSNSNHGKNKLSLSEKIKAKLHKHHVVKA
jgi:hypothetical protein